MHRAAAGLVVVAALAAPVAAQPPPSCPGDCDLDGVVKIDELLRGVNFLLASEPADGCEELDDDIDGQVEVNEIILAVLDALNGCRIEGDDAAEAGASAAVGVVDTFQVIDLGSAAANAPGSGSGGAGAAAAAADFEVGSAAGQTPPCPDGGALEESCTSSATSSRLTVTYDDCRARVGEGGGVLELRVDGQLVRTVANGTYCATREILDGVRVQEELRDFGQTVRSDAGVTVFALSADFSREYTVNGVGCAGRPSSESLDGRLGLRCDPGQQIATCPAGGRDIALRLRELQIVRQSVPSPGPCTRTRVLSGRVDLRDAISGLAFDALYRQFRIHDIVGSGTPLPTNFTGGIALDCLGEIDIATEIPLRRDGDERCPAAGLLFLRFPDGLQHAVRYDRGGLEIDLDRDGKPDIESSSCEERSLRQCE